MHQTRHLHVTATETTTTGTRKKKGLTSEPTYSKASRRFYNENFKESENQRLSKVLAAVGVASRRSCEELIFDGRVTINGSVCNTPQTKVDPKKDMIYVNGNRLHKKLPPKVYLALNKTKGYICSSGESQTKSVISLFDDYMKSWDKRNPRQPKPRLFTVGRLDVATTGLIIVTNDGEFAQKISHPSCGLSKESCLDENEAFFTTADSAVGLLHKATKPVVGWKGVEYKAAFPILKPPGASFYPPDMDKMVNETKNVLKLCDFGNAIFAVKNGITAYLMSCFYRATEMRTNQAT